MDFTGRVYFSLAEADVYRFYRMLEDAVADGVRIGVEWVGISAGGVPGGPLTGDALATAVAEELRQQHPGAHAAYIQLMLAAIHTERIAVDHPGLVARALEKAGADPGAVLAPSNAATLRNRIEETSAAAADLGVTAVPALYRHGPVLHVRTSGALATGSAVRRLELIDAMLEDDGLWELRKP